MVLPNEYRKNATVNKKVIGQMKNELGKRHMREFNAMSPKAYAYKEIQVDGTVIEDKKARRTRKTVTKKTLSLYHYKNCLFNNKVVKCTQYRIKSTFLSLETVQINKIALKINDDRGLRSFNDITTYRYGTSAFMVCLEELKMRQALPADLESQK